MFSKAKDNSPQQQRTPEPAKRRTGRAAAPSIISSDMVVTGNVTATGGDIQIDGTVEGDVRSVSLTIGEGAIINGQVIADHVAVRGRVMGSIRARKVQLCSSAHVEGDILHEALAVETGAYFEGNCRHSDDPLSEKTEDPAKPGAQAAAAQADRDAEAAPKQPEKPEARAANDSHDDKENGGSRPAAEPRVAAINTNTPKRPGFLGGRTREAEPKADNSVVIKEGAVVVNNPAAE